MKYSDLVEKGADDTRKPGYLVDGNMTTVTIGISKNLRDAEEEESTLKGVSFSAFVCMRMIGELVKKG